MVAESSSNYKYLSTRSDRLLTEEPAGMAALLLLTAGRKCLRSTSTKLTRSKDLEGKRRSANNKTGKRKGRSANNKTGKRKGGQQITQLVRKNGGQQITKLVTEKEVSKYQNW